MTPLLLAGQDAPCAFHGLGRPGTPGLRSGDVELLKLGYCSRESRGDQRRRHAGNTRYRRGCRTPAARGSTRTVGTLPRACTPALSQRNPSARRQGSRRLTHRVSVRATQRRLGTRNQRDRRRNNGRPATGCLDRSSTEGGPLYSADSCCDAIRHTRRSPVNGPYGSHNGTRSTGSKPMLADRNLRRPPRKARKLCDLWSAGAGSSRRSRRLRDRRRAGAGHQATTPPTSRSIKPMATVSSSISRAIDVTGLCCHMRERGGGWKRDMEGFNKLAVNGKWNG